MDRPGVHRQTPFTAGVGDTYYRLSRDGDNLLRFLSGREGKVNVLRHLPDGRAIVQRLARTGSGSPRTTAAEWEMEFEYVRHLYRALRRVGLVTQCDGEPVDGEARSATDRTYYVTTETGDDVLKAVGSE